jgi:hypothetical protein
MSASAPSATSSLPEGAGEPATDAGAGPATARTRRRRVLQVVLLLAIGALVFLPALRSPLFLDDHLQGAMVEGTFPAARSPFNLYDFINDADRATLTARGLLPWWSEPTLTLRFFRPLSSALLWIDHRVFSHAALPMHLHSLVWWVLAVLSIRALYSRLFSPRVVLLATSIFALAPCHALPLAWVANRETLLSLTFGALALAAQARWRGGRHGRDAATAALFFALALLGGGEYALCFGGYVVAMDAVRRESLARRVSGWGPFLVPAVAYLAVRHALGYGATGTGFYSDPFRDTASFLAGAPWRFVALLGTGWLTIDAEILPLGASRWALAGIVIVAAAGLFLPVRWALAALPKPARATAAWLLVGSVVALVPTLAVVPSRRLLGASMIGISAIVALLLDRAWFPAKGEPLVARGLVASLASLAALGLGFAHLVHGPGTAWLSALRHNHDATDFASRVAWLRHRVGDPRSAEIGTVRGLAGAFFAPFALDPRGAAPRRWCVLGQSGHVLALRPDARTMVLVAMPGHSLYPVGERGLYRSTRAPFKAGDQVSVPGMQVTVLDASGGGVRSARFVFDFDPSTLLWLNDRFEMTTEVTLPEAGFGAPFDP